MVPLRISQVLHILACSGTLIALDEMAEHVTTRAQSMIWIWEVAEQPESFQACASQAAPLIGRHRSLLLYLAVSAFSKCRAEVWQAILRDAPVLGAHTLAHVPAAASAKELVLPEYLHARGVRHLVAVATAASIHPLLLSEFDLTQFWRSHWLPWRWWLQRQLVKCRSRSLASEEGYEPFMG